jgi:hypothetical protein
MSSVISNNIFIPSPKGKADIMVPGENPMVAMRGNVFHDDAMTGNNMPAGSANQDNLFLPTTPVEKEGTRAAP